MKLTIALNEIQLKIISVDSSNLFLVHEIQHAIYLFNVQPKGKGKQAIVESFLVRLFPSRLPDAVRVEGVSGILQPVAYTCKTERLKIELNIDFRLEKSNTRGEKSMNRREKCFTLKYVTAQFPFTFYLF